MITAIDFGCHEIRSAFRSPKDDKIVNLYTERAEYAVLPAEDRYRQILADKKIPYAECEQSLVVFGNRAEQVRWLSRKPCAPLLADGKIPTVDAPARQILSVLTKAILPPLKPENGSQFCCFSAPVNRSNAGNSEFLSRLIRMHGYIPVECSAGHAVTLATGNETRFSGITILIGADSSQVSISRFGRELASESINVGANWIDNELAEQFKLRTWDESGECYPDFSAIREWKHDPKIHLRNGFSEQEKSLSRLYGVVLTRVARCLKGLLQSSSALKASKERLTVVCAGGATQVGGFAAALTERFVEQDIAGNMVSVRIANDPVTAVVRGLLIQGELEQRRVSDSSVAA